ncbi:MAG: reductive dehalogenase [Deferrisomatales bacterium]|nr:reductive dehalogenase [Deferrisomatales bacterium]
MFLLALLLLVNLFLAAGTALFVYESLQEQELLAPRRGYQLLAALGVATVVVLLIPPARGFLATAYGLGAGVFALLLVPFRRESRALKGTRGYVVGEVQRMDERDIVFARNRSIRPGSEEYQLYYEQLHPEWKERDDRRRALGGPLSKPGKIDNWRPNSALMFANFQIPSFLGPHAEAAPLPDHPPAELEPERASEIIKGIARHLGAAAVGVCKVDPRWVYSRRGEIFNQNWEEWGTPIAEFPPYAVVIATEMDHEMVQGAPHTPAVVESTANYARGAYITTILAQWFGAMGYRGEAEHNRHYKCLMVPLAVDAGLGELGRFGYLISDQVGARCRIFACLTDMPLATNEPVDLGAEGFCEKCRKCADSCPSRSIPKGEKTVAKGTRRWMLDADTCFAYWGKIGTDCCVCMSVCPFSRPNRSLHKVVRWMVKRSPLAQRLFPYVDNFLYGTRWKPRQAPAWVDYPRKGTMGEMPGADEVPEISSRDMS